MNEVLDKVSELIEKSNNIPNDIKTIVKAICRGYIRESKGKIPIEGIMNVCNTIFIKEDENDLSFAGEGRKFGHTDSDYDSECNVIHKMHYVDANNYIKLITILTHELGHVITEPKPCTINDDGTYPWIKMTSTLCRMCEYKEKVLYCQEQLGYRMSDGFLESICTKIFNSSEFRQELLQSGFDLKDYIYKDERIFPSRVYDEYKACFELFDYILNGLLFDFSCRTFESNEELANYINKYKLYIIFGYLDKSNNTISSLKEYEGKEPDEKFNELLQKYLKEKNMALKLAKVLLERSEKKSDDETFKELYDIYASTLKKQKQLPIPDEYLKSKEHQL